jgi:hypothetical protein
MQMSGKHDQEQIDGNYQEWWDKNVHHKTMEKWRPAVQAYLDFEYLKPTHEKFSIELVKRIISHAGKYDDCWKKFPRDSFDHLSYKAHNVFYLMVEEELRALQADAEEQKRAA